MIDAAAARRGVGGWWRGVSRGPGPGEPRGRPGRASLPAAGCAAVPGQRGPRRVPLRRQLVRGRDRWPGDRREQTHPLRTAAVRCKKAPRGGHGGCPRGAGAAAQPGAAGQKAPRMVAGDPAGWGDGQQEGRTWEIPPGRGHLAAGWVSASWVGFCRVWFSEAARDLAASVTLSHAMNVDVILGETFPGGRTSQ